MIQDKTFTNKASHIDNRNREKYFYFLIIHCLSNLYSIICSIIKDNDQKNTKYAIFELHILTSLKTFRAARH